MNPEIKAKWIEALRSGKYEQGKNYLRVGDRYCCLGVLADVSGATWEGDEEGADHCHADRNGFYAIFKDAVAGEEQLPDEVAARLGLAHADQKKLWTMNDEDRNSFAEIADYIEKNL